MAKYLKEFATNTERTEFENGELYVEPYASSVLEDGSIHYNNKDFFCKLTLNDSSVVKIVDEDGNGKLTSGLTKTYKQSTVSAEIGNLCTSVEMKAFSGFTSLTSVTFTEGLTTIKDYAFYQCTNLTSVRIPSTVIEVRGFEGCTNLENVTIPEGVQYITSAFNGCSKLANITLPNGLLGIYAGAFAGTGLISIVIPSSVTSMDTSVFRNCSSLSNITSLAVTAPSVSDTTFSNIASNGTLHVPQGSTGYDVWMGTGNYYLGKYNWTMVEQ